MIPEEITRIEHPIDVMYLIHKALRAEAERLERMVRELEIGSSLQPVRVAFNTWTASLVYHAQQEDQFMTPTLSNSQEARDNEAEHAVLGEMLEDTTSFFSPADAPQFARQLAQQVTDAMLAVNEQQHGELVARLEEVMGVLNEEIGKTKLIARTHRHLYSKIVALRTAQDDHLENEEAFVLPQIWLRTGEEEQLDMVRHLLMDEEAEDPRWVLDWMAQYLTSSERGLLANVEERCARALSTIT